MSSRSHIRHFTLPSPIGIHLDAFSSSKVELNNASDNKLFPKTVSSTAFSGTIPDSDGFDGITVIFSSLYSLFTIINYNV